MPNAALIQAKIWYGYGKAAAVLGAPFAQYRPTDPLAPIGAASQVSAALPVSLSADVNFNQPNKYGNAVWKCLADGARLQVGDYLVGDQGTYFVASIQPMLPLQAVECNRTLTVGRAEDVKGIGVQPYAGVTQETLVPLLVDWPASVLEGTKGQATGAGLPGDTRAPWWKLILPPIPGVTLQFGDVATDEIGRRYVLSSAELTDMGWRLTAQQSEI